MSILARFINTKPEPIVVPDPKYQNGDKVFRLRQNNIQEFTIKGRAYSDSEGFPSEWRYELGSVHGRDFCVMQSDLFKTKDELRAAIT